MVPKCRAFASCAWVAPIEVAGDDRDCHRWSRSGMRPLKRVLHLVAVAQVRVPHGADFCHCNCKVGEGKTETIPCAA